MGDLLDAMERNERSFLGPASRAMASPGDLYEAGVGHWDRG